MGFFDKLIGKREPKKQEARENQQQVTSVAPEISNSKPSVSDTFDYRNLFCHSLRLNVAAEKMGISSEDFNKLFEDGNLEEKDENGNKILAGNVKNFQIAVQFNDKTITAVIKKIIDDLRAHQVTLTFDSFSHLETQRSIQDIELKSDGRYKSTNQILFERDPNRVEKVKYTHKRLRTDEECEAIEASIDNLYRQTPEGKTLLEQIESWEEATKESEPIRTEHQFYPSYSKNTVLIKQFDLSQITEDISTLECLHGVDDLKVSRLAEAREAIKNDRAILRAIHLFEENKRVRKVVEALNNKDFEAFKEVIQASGNSSYKYLQNIYSNHDEKNQAVSLALALTEMITKDHGVCRVHGGGFAGTIQAFVEDDYVQTYKTEIEKCFGEGSCHVLKVRKYGGKKVI